MRHTRSTTPLVALEEPGLDSTRLAVIAPVLKFSLALTGMLSSLGSRHRRQLVSSLFSFVEKVSENISA